VESVAQNIDVAVIGGGPAGLGAAIRAKEYGAKNVTIIERAEQLGGLLHQCVHNGFGLLYFNEDCTGPEYAHRFIKKALDAGINPMLETMVLDVTSDKKVTVCNKDGCTTLNPKAVVLALGCRERTRHQIQIPGFRPTGVLTAGTAQRLVNVEGYLPGKEIVILGSGDIGMIMARRLTLEGANVKAVVEILPYCGGLMRNQVQCLRDFDIPLFLGHTVTQICGRERVEAVIIAKLDDKGEPMPETERVIGCDTLLLSVGLIPENELSLKAGVILNPVTGGPVVDERRETNIPGMFAGGNVVHVNDLVDWVSWEGEMAGENAAKYATGETVSPKRQITLTAGKNIRYVMPASITGESKVTLQMRVKEPQEWVEVKVGNIFSKRCRVVAPAEMITLELTEEHLSKLSGISDLTVDCRKRR
jgi:NADPH-dependent 2,4-dienoyl-CoA reductase/sulfur reductase-like enzyme